MEKSCLLLTNKNSEILEQIKQICDSRDISLNYAYSVLTFFQRYYELFPNIIVIDTACDIFLIKQALKEVPNIFSNSIFIASDVESIKAKFSKLENLTVVKIEDINQAIKEKEDMIKVGEDSSLEGYEGKRLNDKVIEELNRLIMKQNLKGYSILKELIISACVNKFNSMHTMAQMYNTVCMKFNISVDCLERNIRTVVRMSYNRKDSKLKEVFPLRSPTNKQLLVYLIEKMAIDAKEFHEKTVNNIQYHNSIKKK